MAVCLVDALGGTDFVIIASVTTALLLASAFLGPRWTGVYALVAFIGASAVAIADQVTAPHSGGGATARVIRLAAIALGCVVAVGISRARQAREHRLVRLSEVADVAQGAIVGSIPGAVRDLRFAVFYKSAVPEARVGGDLHEVLDTPWGVRLIVGDVRGKGLCAVHLASRVLGAFRALAKQFTDPVSLVVALDHEVTAVCDDGADACLADFATAVVAQIDRAGWMQLHNAGHPDPLRIRGRTVEALPSSPRCPPLGLGTVPEASRVFLARLDRVLFYSDGVTDARDPATREFFPLVRATQEAFTGRELQEGLARLADALVAWTGGAHADDVTLVAVERCGAPRPSVMPR